MIIDHDRKFVFIHVPKTAGTSIRSQLVTDSQNQVNLWHQGWVSSESRVVDLAHLPGYLAKRVLQREGAESYYKFAFVRDPKLRFISGLKEVARRHAAEFGLGSLSGLVSFLEHLRPASVAFDWTLVHLCPQHVFLYAEGSILVDEIVVDLTQMPPRLSELLGDRDLPTLRAAKPSAIDDWVLELDQRIEETVLRLYWKDYELLFGGSTRPQVQHDSDRVQASLDPMLRTVTSPDHTWSENMLRCWTQAQERLQL